MNIWAEYGLEVPKSKWEMPLKLEDNDNAKILWDIQIWTIKLGMTYQPDIVVVDQS